MTKFSELLGKTLVSVTVASNKETMDFAADDGTEYQLYHSQDCCETVELYDVCGDLSDLIGSPLTMAEEVCFEQDQSPVGLESEASESFSWTFYKLATIKGSVTLRWLGSSNGYYSEAVYFRQTQPQP